MYGECHLPNQPIPSSTPQTTTWFYPISEGEVGSEGLREGDGGETGIMDVSHRRCIEAFMGGGGGSPGEEF